MISLHPKSIRSILCIGAHSDDIEIGCGGTILELLDARDDIEVRWIVLSGDETRAAEARKSAAGFLKKAKKSNVEVMGFQDAHFPYSDALSLKDYFKELRRTCEPDLVFSHRTADVHQDHRFVAELTWQHFRDHMILEYEIPKYEGDLGQPTVFVPLSKKTARSKSDLITSSFKSQQEKPWFSADTFDAMHRIRGIECHSPTGLAEGFYCRKSRLDFTS